MGAGLVEFKALDDHLCFTFEPSQRLWLIENVPLYPRVAIVAMNKDGFYTMPARSLVAPKMALKHSVDKGIPLHWSSLRLSSDLLRATVQAWL